MNGIYDFENYRTPYLDVEMLMERKAKKRERRMLVLAGIAAVLMMVSAIVILCNIAVLNKELFVVSYIIFAIYMIVGAVLMKKIVKKKGEYLWQAL